MTRIFFTRRERTQKNYTVADAIKAADVYLRDRNLRTCMNAVSRHSPDEAITLLELNKISEQLIGDSLHHESRIK